MKSEKTDKENVYFLLFIYLYRNNFDLIGIFTYLYAQSILSKERRYCFCSFAFYIDVRISHERALYLIYFVEYDRPSWKFTLGEIRFF